MTETHGKLVAEIDGNPINAHEVYALMLKARFLSLSFINPTIIKPDWIGFLDGKLVRMMVDPEKFYRELSMATSDDSSTAHPRY